MDILIAAPPHVFDDADWFNPLPGLGDALLADLAGRPAS